MLPAWHRAGVGAKGGWGGHGAALVPHARSPRTPKCDPKGKRTTCARLSCRLPEHPWVIPAPPPSPSPPAPGLRQEPTLGGTEPWHAAGPPPGRAPRSDTAPRTPPERRLVPLFSNGQGTGTSLRGGGSTHARSLSAPGTPGLCSPSETPGRGGCRRIRGTGAASRRCPRSPGRLRDAQVGAAEPSGGAGGAGPFGFPVFVLPPRPGNEEAAEGRDGSGARSPPR